jgi:hypothetical protein
MDASSRLIWFFEHFLPYFQSVYAVVVLCCALLCFWSAVRQSSAAILLLGIGCCISFMQSSCWVVSAFQEGQPFLAFLPFELRKQAYLCGRLLGPIQLVLFPTTVVMLAFHNVRGRRPNQAMQPTAGRSEA